jgi:hypothetical protein
VSEYEGLLPIVPLDSTFTVKIAAGDISCPLPLPAVVSTERVCPAGTLTT